MDGSVSPASGAQAVVSPTGVRWYHEVSPEQWRAFVATFLGWVVDAFDFNILSFIVIDIQKSFTVKSGLAGLLDTVQLDSWGGDAFDFNILSFIVIDIQKSFTVNSGLAGLLATVTLVMRLVGGVVAGT